MAKKNFYRASNLELRRLDEEFTELLSDEISNEDFDVAHCENDRSISRLGTSYVEAWEMHNQDD